MARPEPPPTDIFAFNELPLNLIYHILNNYTDFKGKLKAQRVCQTWKQCIDMSFDRKVCIIIVDYELNEHRIDQLNRYTNRVSVIKMASFDMLGRSDNKDKQFVTTVLKKYTQLITLCVCLKYTKCNNFILELIAQNGSQTLQSLRLEFSDCSMNGRTLFITQQEVLDMSDKFPNLKYFYVDYLILHITGQSIQTMFAKWTNIETIVFHSQCFRGIVYNSDPVINDISLTADFNGESIVIGSTSLAKLEMPGNILNLDTIGRIPHPINIKRLFVMKINMNAIETICKQLSALESFGVSIETDISEEDLYLLMENIANLKLLKQLYIAIFSDVVVNYNCIKLLRFCKQLKTLQLDQTLINAFTIDGITRYFPKLECLEVWTSGLNRNFHICLTDDIIANIKRLKCLKKLNVRGQRYLSDQSIADILTNCLQLDVIDVRKTKAAIISLNVLIAKSCQSDHTIQVFINETPISQTFTQKFRTFELCKHLVLNNHEYDHKIDF